jgi:hypothetical protein
MFHPQYECSHNVSEIGYRLKKLGASSQDLQDFILERLDLTKNMSSNKV